MYRDRVRQQLPNSNCDTKECDKMVVERNVIIYPPIKGEDIKQIFELLSKIAKNIRTVRFKIIEKDLFPAIVYFFENIEKMELDADIPLSILTRFKKLKKLKELELLGDTCIWSAETLTNIIMSIENLESIGLPYDKAYVELLSRISPKLKKLWLYNVPGDHDKNDFLQLQYLRQLTNLSIGCETNCTEIIRTVFATIGLRLVELTLCVPYEVNTFNLIAQFTNLECLSMVHPQGVPELPEFRNLPTKLKSIDFRGVIISCATFWSAVHHLPYLQEFAIGNIIPVHGNYDEQADGLDDLGFVKSLADGLKHLHRTMKITYSSVYHTNKQSLKCVDHGNLILVNRYFETILPNELHLYV